MSTAQQTHCQIRNHIARKTSVLQLRSWELQDEIAKAEGGIAELKATLAYIERRKANLMRQVPQEVLV